MFVGACFRIILLVTRTVKANIHTDCNYCLRLVWPWLPHLRRTIHPRTPFVTKVPITVIFKHNLSIDLFKVYVWPSRVLKVSKQHHHHINIFRCRLFNKQIINKTLRMMIWCVSLCVREQVPQTYRSRRQLTPQGNTIMSIQTIYIPSC